MFLSTNCKSYTGQIIYSDCYYQVPGAVAEVNENTLIKQRPFLNTWAAIPFIGSFAGLTRIVLSIIHILGHLIFAAIYREKGHLYHAAKGVAELLRGTIETIPLIGRVFVWGYDPNSMRNFFRFIFCNGGFYDDKIHEEWNFFLIKIVNPDQPDHIDRLMEKSTD